MSRDTVNKIERYRGSDLHVEREAFAERYDISEAVNRCEQGLLYV